MTVRGSWVMSMHAPAPLTSVRVPQALAARTTDRAGTAAAAVPGGGSA